MTSLPPTFPPHRPVPPPRVDELGLTETGLVELGLRAPANPSRGAPRPRPTAPRPLPPPVRVAPAPPRRGARRALVLAAVLALVGGAGLIHQRWSSPGAAASPSADPVSLAAGWAPGTADGLVTRGARPSVFDDVPAVANLDATLLEAIRAAATDARAAGIEFEVTSGWRSAEYQQWLLDEAIAEHGSLEAARTLVSTPELSRHVSGTAIDIGPTAADDWLIRKGSAYGLCQVYANEMWHFERLTEPGGACPDLLPDASGG